MTKGIQVACASGQPSGERRSHTDGVRGLQDYADQVRVALETSYGTEFARTILYYVGIPEEETFAPKLQQILGGGAEIVLWQVALRVKTQRLLMSGPQKQI